MTEGYSVYSSKAIRMSERGVIAMGLESQERKEVITVADEIKQTKLQIIANTGY